MGSDENFLDPQGFIPYIFRLEFNCGFEEIINWTINEQITVTEDEIKAYLNKKFIEENEELKLRLDKTKNKKYKSLNEWGIDDIKESLKNFSDELQSSRYHFEPFTLEYFQSYTNILKGKILLIVDYLKKISEHNTSSIEKELKMLDITLDEFGNISLEDAERLINTLTSNLKDLCDKINRANNLETYLNFKLSRNFLYQSASQEIELYPYEMQQIINAYSTPSYYDTLKKYEQEKLLSISQNGHKKSLEILLRK